MFLRLPARSLALTLVLSACVHTTASDAVVTADGVPCSPVPASGPVYIRVSYAADGTPQVSTDECAIRSGTDVTWVGPDDEPVQFRIRFKAASPAPDGAREFDADKTGSTYKVKRTLAGADGSYPYAVIANGHTLDPAIIIR